MLVIGGLSCVNQLVQSKDATFILSIIPVKYLPEDVDVGVAEASGSCCLLYKLKASTAYGKRLSGLSNPEFLVSVLLLLRCLAQAHQNGMYLQVGL